MSAQALARTCRFCLWAFWAFLTREHRWNGDTAKLNAQIETALCKVSQVIPHVPSLFTLLRPYLAQFSLFPPVFGAFSSPRRGGSSEPQAGTQGQETAARGKRGEFSPSFDTADANQRINWGPHGRLQTRYLAGLFVHRRQP